MRANMPLANTQKLKVVGFIKGSGFGLEISAFEDSLSALNRRDFPEMMNFVILLLLGLLCTQELYHTQL